HAAAVTAQVIGIYIAHAQAADDQGIRVARSRIQHRKSRHQPCNIIDVRGKSQCISANHRGSAGKFIEGLFALGGGNDDLLQSWRSCVSQGKRRQYTEQAAQWMKTETRWQTCSYHVVKIPKCGQSRTTLCQRAGPCC